LIARSSLSLPSGPSKLKIFSIYLIKYYSEGYIFISTTYYKDKLIIEDKFLCDLVGLILYLSAIINLPLNCLKSNKFDNLPKPNLLII
jgi:hypothetical protein